MIKIRASSLRFGGVLFFLALTAVGLSLKTGIGTLSAFGYRNISAICPLGAIEAVVASRTFLPAAMISVAGIALLVIVLGRVFCAWACPVPAFGSLLKGPGKRLLNGTAATTPPGTIGENAPPSEPHPQKKISKICVDSRHFILGGALLSTAMFGFPVFCLICPIGLIFATFIGIWRLFQFNEPSWTLLLFPAIIILELVACRKWCRKICPVGALLSILSSLNLLFRPRVDPKACARLSKRLDCTLCKAACPEEIDLHHVRQSQPLSECTKCRKCADSCQTGAITFPFYVRKNGRN